MPDAPLDLQSVLQELFRGHGVDASLEGDWVRLPRAYARVQAEVVSETPHPGSLVVQLDVRVFVDFGRVILESFAGIGETREDAVRNALQAFCEGSLHVLLAAFFDKPLEQVEPEEWVVGGVARRVFVGPAVVKGRGPKPETFVFDWFPALRRTIEASELAEGTQWVRVYVGGAGDGPPDVEVLLDNDPWPQARAVLAARDWPRGQGFFSTRVFLVMRGGLDVAEAAGVLHDLRDQPAEAAADEMVRRGAARGDAELAAAMVPLAFGRVLLEQLGVRLPDFARLMTPGGVGDGRKIRLSTHRVFKQASAFARAAAARGTLGRDEFGAFAMASPEVQAVNELLHRGSKAGDLALVPPMILVSAEAVIAGAGTGLGGSGGEGDRASAPLGPALAKSGPAAKRKPWWRWW